MEFADTGGWREVVQVLCHPNEAMQVAKSTGMDHLDFLSYITIDFSALKSNSIHWK
jgi:hypothetical protein